MKFLERLSLAIFSIIILVLSVIMSLMAFGWIEVSAIAFSNHCCCSNCNFMLSFD